MSDPVWRVDSTPFLYPQPYLHQLPREEAVVVVNEDGSQPSRQLEFAADATPQVKLVARVDSLTAPRSATAAESARPAASQNIPDHLYRDSGCRQESAVTLSYAGDRLYFLVCFWHHSREGLGPGGLAPWPLQGQGGRRLS